MSGNEEQNIETTITDAQLVDAQTTPYMQDLSIPTDQQGYEGQIKVGVDGEGVVFLFCKAQGVWHSQLLGGVDFGSEIVQQSITNIVVDGNLFEGMTLNVGNLIAQTVVAEQEYGDGTNDISSNSLIQHPDDNTQAHTDYLKNNAHDELEGTLKIEGSYSSAPTGTWALEIGDGALNAGQYNLNVGNPDNIGSTDGTEVYARRIGLWTNAPTSKLHMNTSGHADAFHLNDSTGNITLHGASHASDPATLNLYPYGSNNLSILASDHVSGSNDNYGHFNFSDGGLFLMKTSYGDIALGPQSGGIVRGDAVGINLGSSSTPWQTLFAQELYVETLVSQDVFATQGGRITVTPSTTLEVGVNDTITTWKTQHNNYVIGDWFYLKKGINFEVVLVTATPAADNDGLFDTTVTRGVDGTAVAWDIGDALQVLDSSVGSGFIDLTATSTILTDIGPTQIFQARETATTWDDYHAKVIIGNMNGALDYASQTFGMAIGTDLLGSMAGDSKFISMDDVNGLRSRNLPLEMYAYDNSPGTWFKFFEVEPSNKMFAFGKDVTGANTTNMRMFGKQTSTTYNTISYDSGDVLFGSTSSGYANMIFSAYQVAGGTAQNIIRIGTGDLSGLDSMLINADGSGSVADGNISWDSSGDLTLTGTLTNIDDQIDLSGISGTNVYHQNNTPDQSNDPVPAVGDLWYETDAGNKCHFLEAITDVDSSGTVGDNTSDYEWTDVFYTQIDGSHITTGNITAINLVSYEVTTDTGGVIPGSHTGNKVAEFNMDATPFIRQYKQQDSPEWASTISGGKLSFTYFVDNTETTYDYVKAQQMINAQHQKLNVTQTFTSMGAKKMPDAKYVVIPVEARMPDLNINSSYCDDGTLDNYMGYIFDQKTNLSFRAQMIVYYGEESGWMRIPYVTQIGHNQHINSIDNRQHTDLDSPILLYPEPSHSDKEYFGNEQCGGSWFGYLYNRADSSAISSSRGLFPNQIFQWTARKNDSAGGWTDFNDGSQVSGGDEENGSFLADQVDATTYRAHRGIPNQWNDENYYAGSDFRDPIFGTAREGWKNGPLWRDLATQTDELVNSDYDNSGTGNLAELDNGSGLTYNPVVQGQGHDGSYSGGNFDVTFGCGTWTSVGSNYAEPIFFGNSMSGSAGSDFYGEWLDTDNDDSVWHTGINLLRWRSRAHIVYKAHDDNDDFGLHWAYETDAWVDDSTTGKGHIAWGAIVQGQCFSRHASLQYAYSSDEFGSPNMHTNCGRMHKSREENDDRHKVGPIINVVPDSDLSMNGLKEGVDSNGLGAQGTFYRNDYGFVCNGSTVAQNDANLYWHYRTGNGQISWYESDNNAQGSMEIDGDADWNYIVKHYEREHTCASGIDDQGMWAPIGHANLGYIQDLQVDTSGSAGVGPQHLFGMQVPCGWMSRWNPQDSSSPFDDELFIGTSDKSPELVYFSWGRLEGKAIPIPIRRLGTGTGTDVHNISGSADITRKLFGQHIMAVDSASNAEQNLVTVDVDIAPFDADDWGGFASGIEDLLPSNG